MISKPRLIVRVRVDAPALIRAFEYGATFFRLDKQAQSIGMYMEVVHDGFLFFFQSLEDLDRYDEKKHSVIPTATWNGWNHSLEDLPRQKNPIRLEVEVMKAPAGFSVKDVVKRLIKTYAFLLCDPEVDLDPPFRAKLTYPNPVDIGPILDSMFEDSGSSDSI